jgi:hypothetical protein
MGKAYVVRRRTYGGRQHKEDGVPERRNRGERSEDELALGPEHLHDNGRAEHCQQHAQLHPRVREAVEVPERRLAGRAIIRPDSQKNKTLRHSI